MTDVRPDRIIQTPGILGEAGPTVHVKRKKDGTVERTLHAPTVDPTLGAAAVIIATQAAGTEKEAH